MAKELNYQENINDTTRTMAIATTKCAVLRGLVLIETNKTLFVRRCAKWAYSMGNGILTVKTRSLAFSFVWLLPMYINIFQTNALSCDDIVSLSLAWHNICHGWHSRRRSRHKCIILFLFVCIKPNDIFFFSWLFSLILMSKATHPFAKHRQKSYTYPLFAVHLLMEKNWLHLFLRDNYKCTQQ